MDQYRRKISILGPDRTNLRLSLTESAPAVYGSLVLTAKPLVQLGTNYFVSFLISQVGYISVFICGTIVLGHAPTTSIIWFILNESYYMSHIIWEWLNFWSFLTGLSNLLIVLSASIKTIFLSRCLQGQASTDGLRSSIRSSTSVHIWTFYWPSSVRPPTSTILNQ